MREDVTFREKQVDALSELESRRIERFGEANAELTTAEWVM